MFIYCYTMYKIITNFEFNSRYMCVIIIDNIHYRLWDIYVIQLQPVIY